MNILLHKRFNKLGYGLLSRPITEQFSSSLFSSSIGNTVTETSDSYQVDIPISGMRKNDVVFHVEGNLVTVTGKSQSNTLEEGETTIRAFHQQQFSQSFTLPAYVNAKKLKSSWSGNLLTLKFPKYQADYCETDQDDFTYYEDISLDSSSNDNVFFKAKRWLKKKLMNWLSN